MCVKLIPCIELYEHEKLKEYYGISVFKSLNWKSI